LGEKEEKTSVSTSYNSRLCYQCSAEFDSTRYCNVLPHNDKLLQSAISQAGNKGSTLL